MNQTDLTGTRAVITGASRGLGAALARRLNRAGVHLLLCGRDQARLDQLATELRAGGGVAHAYSFDLADRGAVIEFAARAEREVGPVDVLINNAGLGWYKPFLEHSLDELDAIIDVNLKGLMFLTHALLPGMIARKQGQIINIASDLGRRVLPKMAPYVAAKHGVMGFAGSLMREVKDQGIKVMTLTPGIIDTDFGGGEAGTREETWSLKPETIADWVATMLAQGPYVMLDEVSIHAMHQEF